MHSLFLFVPLGLSLFTGLAFAENGIEARAPNLFISWPNVTALEPLTAMVSTVYYCTCGPSLITAAVQEKTATVTPSTSPTSNSSAVYSTATSISSSSSSSSFGQKSSPSAPSKNFNTSTLSDFVNDSLSSTTTSVASNFTFNIMSVQSSLDSSLPVSTIGPSSLGSPTQAIACASISYALYAPSDANDKPVLSTYCIPTLPATSSIEIAMTSQGTPSSVPPFTNSTIPASFSATRLTVPTADTTSAPSADEDISVSTVFSVSPGQSATPDAKENEPGPQSSLNLETTNTTRSGTFPTEPPPSRNKRFRG